MDENQLTGIILSGGKSSRMGGEKGLAEFRGKPLISYSIEALNPVVDSVIISANNHMDVYRNFGFDVVKDEVSGIGPMGGLLSTLKFSATEYNLVLSCDTPFINSGLLSYLAGNIQDYEVVVVAHGNNKLEPLCGVYSRNIISILENNVYEGKYKLRDIFKQVRFKVLTVDASLPFYSTDLFYNINKPEDLNL